MLLKEKQLELLLEINPMTDDYHTGIRKLEDIKSFKEAVNDDIKDEEIGAYPDFTKEDASKAIKDGYITIYSSHPIENGVFVTPSKMNAQDYAGGNKVYSKKVPLDEVAWINSDEGEYAKVNEVEKPKEISQELKDMAKRDNGIFLFSADTGYDVIESFIEEIEPWNDYSANIARITNDTLDGKIDSIKSAMRHDADLIFIDSQLKSNKDEDDELAHMALRAANCGHLVIGFIEKPEDVKTLDKGNPYFKEHVLGVYNDGKIIQKDELYSEVNKMNLETYKNKIQGIDAYEDEDSLINVLIGTSIIDMAERDGFTEINDDIIEEVEASMAGYIREAIGNTLDEAYDKLFAKTKERD